jgi:hypothetical protein
MMEAAISKSAKLIETQIEMILHVRTAWQLFDSSPLEEPKSLHQVPTERATSSAYASAEAMTDRIPFSQSA